MTSAARLNEYQLYFDGKAPPALFKARGIVMALLQAQSIAQGRPPTLYEEGVAAGKLTVDSFSPFPKHALDMIRSRMGPA